MSNEEEEDGSSYESGPFCQHFGYPAECDEECVLCGHTCAEHSGDTESVCNLLACDCLGFVRKAQ